MQVKTEEVNAFYEALVMAVLIEPKLGKETDPEKNIIAIADLDMQDKTDIWLKASSSEVTAVLENFREESGTVEVIP